MRVDDVFVIKGMKTSVTGPVQQGILHTGDKVCIVGPKGERTDTVVRIDKLRITGRRGTALDLETIAGKTTRAMSGDFAGVFLENLGGDDVERGDTIEKVEA